ncbi:MAG: hypothetical protein JO276_14805 [Sphingomonadaceae bacterium]|nr:hypothetical protein [Sphingomonadaceae bacterium]
MSRAAAGRQPLGLLKLVTGIIGLGLDDLVRRDASRRVRRVTAVTAAAVIAMLVMAVLAVVALDARQDAERERAKVERQRVAAEGLIDFMLTDLRERLRIYQINFTYEMEVWTCVQ